MPSSCICSFSFGKWSALELWKDSQIRQSCPKKEGKAGSKNCSDKCGRQYEHVVLSLRSQVKLLLCVAALTICAIKVSFIGLLVIRPTHELFPINPVLSVPAVSAHRQETNHLNSPCGMNCRIKACDNKNGSLNISAKEQDLRVQLVDGCLHKKQ